MGAKFIFIVGPTASGKSAVGLKLAQELDAEICSVDAFQIYRNLDIGTGKATKAEQKERKHHLLDLVDASENFSVADYLRHAQKVRDDVSQRGKNSIWLGGSGLYFTSLRKGLSAMPASDPKILKQLCECSLEELVYEIQAADASWAAKADLKNRRRVERAVAVWRQTQIPISEWQKKRGKPVIEQSETFFLKPDLNALRKKIEARVHAMWKLGWPDEVEQLLKIKNWEKCQSSNALGYRNVVKYLKGEMKKEECLEKIVLETGQFAKRQLTWFHTEKNLTSIPFTSGEVSDCEKIYGKFKKFL